MATTRVRYPAFFRLQTEDDRRLHEGWPLFAPKIRARKLGAASALQELGRLVHDMCERGEDTLPLKLGAIPTEAVEGTATITVPWQRRRTDIRTPALRFTLGAHPIVCLPRLRNAMLVLPARTPPELQAARLQDAVDAWFRDLDPDERPEGAAEDEEEVWAEQRGDRFLWLTTTVKVERPSFAKLDLMAFLQALSGITKVDGAVELHKVGSPLVDRYPDGLRLDLVPDPRVATLRRLLFEDAKPAPTVLVGPSGAGKTTLVEAATRRYLDGRPEGPDSEGTVQLHHLDPNRVIAGMSQVGAWERRMTAILEHLVQRGAGHEGGGLYVDNPVALSLVGRSAGSALNLCSLLRPWLAARRLPFLLEATPEEWNRLEEADRAFTELFSVIRVDAPARPVAIRMTLANLERIERAHTVRIPLESVRRLLELDERYPSARGAPGSLVDRLDSLASRVGAQGGDPEITPAHVEAAYTGATGLNAVLFDPLRPLPDAELRDRITARLVGQAEAVGVLTDVVHVLRAGLARPQKPLATWLLVGPTGVGKTEAAKVLAELLYPGRDRLLRFDMNELVDAGAVHRLLGDATREGQLTGRVRQDPYSVVLLDEIEKAHPSVHDLLLQLLDEGRLTDARGRRTDFSRAVVILTSNVGSGQRAAGTGFGGSSAGTGSMNASYRAAVERAFRPELVNRLDRIVVFQPLALPDIRRIARLQVDRVLQREGFLRRTVLLEVDDVALERLAAAGFDPDLGARALKRTIERDVVGRMAALLATIPVEAPVVVRIHPVEGGVTAEASVLHFATAEPTRAVPEALDALAINALLDRLPATAFRATASRAGVAIEGREIHQLRDRLQEALRALVIEPGGVDLTNHALARLRDRPRWARYERRWDTFGSFHTVREFVLGGLPLHAWADDGEHELEPVRLRILERKLAASAAGEDETVWLRIRPVTRTGTASRPHVAAYIQSLTTVLDELWPEREVFAWHPERRWEPKIGNVGAPPLLWRLRGPLLGALLSAEVGVHVWYPPDAPPFAIAVELFVDEPMDLAPIGGIEPPIIRLYVPGASASDRNRVEDLRVAEVADGYGVVPSVPFLRWWWQRLGAGEGAGAGAGAGESGMQE
ncbi:MAG: AAA family ATPase [Pseudomonadota bacterium]|nr:AAA family ATPase [Pseudomonadota bacterium]